MHSPRSRRLLAFTTCSLVVLVAGGLAFAATPKPPLPCKEARFTGSVGAAHVACGDKPGSRGRPGLRGKRGFAGSTGPVGTTGATGPIGSSGATGVQGIAGATGGSGSQGIAGTPGTPGAAGPQGPQGSTGLVGPSGATGSTGADGLPGLDGQQGVTGATGAAGAVGPQGPVGATGAAGGTGPSGPIGPAGPAGATGATGPAGSAGATGGTGAAGGTGASGPAGTNGLATYAYVYNLSAQTVAIDAAVTFDSNGVVTAGVTHAPNSAGIVLAGAGDYKITFSTSGTEPSQMALFVDGTAAPGGIYASGAGTQQNVGQVIVTVAAGAVLTVRNHSSAAAVTLATPIGGTEASVNASVTIEKLSP